MRNVKQLFATFGILLWIGAISPEIFIDPVMGCYVNEEGEELSEEETLLLFEELFLQDESEVQIVFRSRIWEWFMNR